MGPADASRFIEIVRVKQKGQLWVLQARGTSGGKQKPFTAQKWKVREVEFGESHQVHKDLKDYALNVAGSKSGKTKGSYRLTAMSFCAIAHSQLPAPCVGGDRKPLLPIMCLLTDSGERVALREHATDAVKLDSWYWSIVDALVGRDRYFELPVLDESSSPPRNRILHITPYNVTVTSPDPTEVWCARSHNIWPASAVDVSFKLDSSKLLIKPLRSGAIVYGFRQGSITAEAVSAIESMLLSSPRYSPLPRGTALAAQVAGPEELKNDRVPVGPRPEPQLLAPATPSYTRSFSSGEPEGKMQGVPPGRSVTKTVSPIPGHRHPMQHCFKADSDDHSGEVSPVSGGRLTISPRPNPRKPKGSEAVQGEPAVVEPNHSVQDSGSSNDFRDVSCSSPKPSPRSLRTTPEAITAFGDVMPAHMNSPCDSHSVPVAVSGGRFDVPATACATAHFQREASSEEESGRQGPAGTPRPAPRRHQTPTTSIDLSLVAMAAPDDVNPTSACLPQLPKSVLEVIAIRRDSSDDDSDSEVLYSDTGEKGPVCNHYIAYDDDTEGTDDIYASYDKGLNMSLYVNLCNSNSLYANVASPDVFKPLLPPLRYEAGECNDELGIPPPIPLRKGVRPNITATLERIINRVPPSPGPDPFRLRNTVRRDFCWQLCLRDSLTGSWQHFAESAIMLTAEEVLMIDKFGKDYRFPPSEIILHHWQYLDSVECTDMLRCSPTRDNLIRILRDLKRDDLVEFLEPSR